MRHMRIERVRMLHTFNVFLRGTFLGQSDHAIVRSSRFDELYLTHDRGNNNGAIGVGSPNANGHWFVNNVIGDRDNRFMTYEAGGVGGATAWNYQVTQGIISGSDTYCDPAPRGGLGRSIFFHGGSATTSGIVIEGNDLHCHIEIDAAFDPAREPAPSIGRRIVFYRNRMTRGSNVPQFGGALATGAGTTSVASTLTIMFNRTRSLERLFGGAILTGAGPTLHVVHNAAERICTVGSALSDGGCTGTGDNPLATFVGNTTSTSALPIAAAGAFPPSLLLSSPPSWWCREACPWGDDAGPGAAEANTGGPLCRTPAQILAEGATCTPL